MSNEALDKVLANLIIPVVVIHDAATTPAVTDGLVVGGLPVAEVTFRTDAATAAIESMASDGRIIVGAGTVISARQVDEAVGAGATFVVSPGLSREVVDRCRHHAIPVLPGVITPTEIMAGIDMGLDTFKFFPAGIFGGAATIVSLGGPFPHLRFVPTGGVKPRNLADFLSRPNIPAVGGTWLTPADAVAARDSHAIANLAREAAHSAHHIVKE
ncbi:MAG: bifunctional 4-hydroxy-2-oxoglutarate aldolase/2-dehydro-3-deoxy-phosphogluconate aldolase [Cutibacterium acnes]|nr:MAG: bifunctional 4-hydroxy-2-oxoglutarate aldolase/2-dehydro-3-deoxy-phosphogluconate aldolase [Cutibacterium acnes]